MEKYFYRLGSIEECAERRRKASLPQSLTPNSNDNIIFTNCIEHEGSVFGPLEQLAENMEISLEDFMCDSLLDGLLIIQKRTGHFPIQKIEI